METNVQRAMRRARILLSRRERLIHAAFLGDAGVGVRVLLEQEVEVVKGDGDLCDGYKAVYEASPYSEERCLAFCLVSRAAADAPPAHLSEHVLHWHELSADPSYSLEISRCSGKPLGTFLAAYCVDAAASLACVLNLDWPQLPDGSLRSFVRLERDADVIDAAVRMALHQGNRRLAHVLLGELSSALSADACLQRTHDSLVSRDRDGGLVISTGEVPPEIRRREHARAVYESLRRVLIESNPAGASQH